MGGFGVGLIRSVLGSGPFFFIDLDQDPDPKSSKFSDPGPDPSDLTGIRSLMGP